MAFDFLGTVLFVATGQALAWAFLPRFNWPIKVGAGILASLTVPPLVSTMLNWVGVPFNPFTVYAVFFVLLGVSLYRMQPWKKR